MAHKTINHLQVQNIPVNDLALSTLASRAALLLASTFGTTLKNTFLVKKVKFFLHLVGAANGEAENILIGIAKGDATAAEMAAALNEINTVGPEDTTQVLTSDNVWTIWQNSVQQMKSDGTGVNAGVEKEITLGKGMPAISEQGIQIFAYNNDGTLLTTGGVINGLVQLWGVWLRD